MDFTKHSPTLLSFCSGIRGLERGLERAFERLRWKMPTVACYVEINAFEIFNLVNAMEKGVLDPAPIFTDLKKFPTAPFRNCIDGILAGFPCQPFSVVGNQQGKEDPRHLWPYIRNHIHAIGPLFFYGENVPGLLDIGYREVRSDLEELGYTVKEGIFSAEEVGAPHRRKRLFILAIRTSELTTIHNSMCGRYRGQEEEIQAGRDGVEYAGEAMEDPHGQRFQESRPGGEQELCPKDENEHTGSEQPGGRDEELGHPESNDQRGKWTGKNKYVKTGGSGQDVAHTHGIDRGLSESNGRINTNETTGGGEIVAHGSIPGLQGHTRDEHRERWEGIGEDRSITESDVSRWPARQGEEQYEWECRRTQPRICSTINGYNFREDFLRALGNSVVEQQAEYAFITLLNQFNQLTI